MSAKAAAGAQGTENRQFSESVKVSHPRRMGLMTRGVCERERAAVNQTSREACPAVSHQSEDQARDIL